MPAKEQIGVAQEYIMDVIEDEGPFYGVIGFSQGAALASSLMLEHMKSSSSRDLLSFCIFAGAGLRFNQDNNDELTTCLEAKKTGKNAVAGEFDCEVRKDDPPDFPSEIYNLTADNNRLGRCHSPRTALRINVPTLHIIGETDPYRGQGRALSQSTTSTESRILCHKEGT